MSSGGPQVTTCATAVQPVVDETKVRFEGKGSVIVTPSAVAVPALSTVIR